MYSVPNISLQTYLQVRDKIRHVALRLRDGASLVYEIALKLIVIRYQVLDMADTTS